MLGAFKHMQTVHSLQWLVNDVLNKIIDVGK